MLTFTSITEHTAAIFWKTQKIGEIRINARDAMIFMDLNENIPMADQGEILAKIQEYLTKDWGGKTILTLPVNYQNAAKQAGFSLKPIPSNVMYFSAENLRLVADNFLIEAGKDDNRTKKLELLSNHFSENKLKLMSDKKELAKKANEIFEFLRDKAFFTNSKGERCSFVNETKIKQGLYSPTAILDRINNEIVLPYCLLNEKGEVIATTFVNKQTDNLAYISDVVLLENERNQGLGEYFEYLILQDIRKNHPALTEANLIAGGIGAESVGMHLNKTVFKGQNVSEVSNETTPVKYGNKIALITFCTPGKLLLNAGNRDENNPDVCLDGINPANKIAWSITQLKQQQFDKTTLKVMTNSSLVMNSPATQPVVPTEPNKQENTSLKPYL